MHDSLRGVQIQVRQKKIFGEKVKKIVSPLKVNFFVEPGFELLAKNDPHSYHKFVFTVKIVAFFFILSPPEIYPPPPNLHLSVDPT